MRLEAQVLDSVDTEHFHHESCWTPSIVLEQGFSKPWESPWRLVKTQTLGPILRVQEVWWLARECAFLTSSQVVLMLLGVLEDPLATSPVNCSDTNLMVSVLISKLQLTWEFDHKWFFIFVLLSWKCFILIPHWYYFFVSLLISLI